MWNVTHLSLPAMISPSISLSLIDCDGVPKPLASSNDVDCDTLLISASCMLLLLPFTLLLLPLLPIAAVAGASWFLMKTDVAVDTKLLMIQYTPRPEGTFKLNQPISSGKYFKTAYSA
jgi:hypothetical protein